MLVLIVGMAFLSSVLIILYYKWTDRFVQTIVCIWMYCGEGIHFERPLKSITFTPGYCSLELCWLGAKHFLVSIVTRWRNVHKYFLTLLSFIAYHNFSFQLSLCLPFFVLCSEIIKNSPRFQRILTVSTYLSSVNLYP